jgi:hypothetical protein
MIKVSRKLRMSLVLIAFTAILLSSAIGSLGFVSATETPQAPPEAAAPVLADEDTIVDPRGQTVKQSQQLDLSREMTLNVIKPFNWQMEILGFNVIEANIPMALDLTLGMGFPLNVETSYDPYEVHANSEFPFVVKVDNDGCNPYATLGVNFGIDFSKLNLNLFQLGNLFSFATSWKPITYNKQIQIPFYGVETKFGDWISYDIIDKYYTLDQILSTSVSNYGVSGGIGVNVNYKIHSWVTSTLDAYDDTGALVKTQDLSWTDTGAQIADIPVGNNLHGDVYSVQVGDWVYHIAHDVTFSIWADIGLSVIGIKLIDETFKYAYTLPLGELTFPERNDFIFESKPEVLTGKVVKNVDATWPLVNFNVNTEGPGNFGLIGYNWEIPQWKQAVEAFDKAGIRAGINAGIDFNMPFNMLSYYNPRKVTNGSTFDYNVLVDSIGADSPSIDYYLDAYLDLSNIEVLGYKLPNIDIDLDGSLYDFNGLATPFGRDYFDIEITSLVQLDTLSNMINDYISDMMYGINPDIQLQAWIVLQLDGYMTGTCTVSGATLVENTPFVWDEQFDTQTSRIQIPSGANPGDKFTVSYSNLVYHLKVTPGIKLGVSVLGGLVSLDHTFFLPVGLNLDKQFIAPSFNEEITVQSLNFEAKNLAIADPNVPNGDFSVSGTFALKNVGSVNDKYIVNLMPGLPAGTTGQWRVQGEIYRALGLPCDANIAPGATKVIEWQLTLGPNAHKQDLYKDELGFKVASNSNPAYNQLLTGGKLNIEPHPDWRAIIDVQMESSIDVVPGVGVVVPVKVSNLGLLQYGFPAVSISSDTGGFASYSGPSSLTLGPGTSQTVNVMISVPSLSTNTPGAKTVNVNVGGVAHVLTYNIMPFVKLNMSLHPLFDSPTEQIYLGANANYNFELTNLGNVQATDVTISVIDTDIPSYKINTVTGPRSFTVGAGGSQDVVVQLVTSAATPGLKAFTVVAEYNGAVIFSQRFDVNILNVEVSIYSLGSYEYTGETLVYSIGVTNKGTSADTFTVSINGLDPSAYTIKNLGVVDNDVWLPGGASAQFTLEIKPTDITKTFPGGNGIQVVVSSANYGVSSRMESSAVNMPGVYKMEFPATSLNLEDSENWYLISFAIENKGNMEDTFTIKVEGIGNMIFEVLVNSVSLTSDSNTFSVARGTKAIVTVRILKSEEGSFTPVVKVYNGAGTLVASYEGSFVMGDKDPGTNWGLVALFAAIGVVGVVSVFVVAQKRQERMYGSASDRTPSKFAQLKDRVSDKIREIRGNKDMSKFKTREDSYSSKGSVSVQSDKLSKGKEFLSKTKDKMAEKFTQVSEKVKTKIETKKQDKQDIKNLANDDAFWADDDKENGWN